MKTTNQYIALAAMALTFAACTQDNDIIPQGDADAVKITATIGKLQTRVSYAERNTTFDEGDQIKVENKLRTSKNVATYTLTDEEWNTADAFVWNGASKNEFEAWYPLTASYTTFTIPTDQSSEQLLGAADWMTASSGEIDKPENHTVKLNFHHQLSKVTVNITEWNDEFGGEAQTVSTPKIDSKGTALTATYDDSGVTITTTGGDTGIDPLVSGTSYTAIVAPAKYATTDKFMTFTVNGQEMTVLATPSSLNEEGLQAGLHYLFDLKVGKDAVTLNSVKVTEWANGGTIDGGVVEEWVPDYVTFSAASSQTMTLSKDGSVALDLSLQYKVGNGVWTDLTFGTPVAFGGSNNDLQLRSKTGEVNEQGTAAVDGNGESTSAKFSFSDANVSVSCSGDIRTLIDHENYQSTSTAQARFKSLFEECAVLTSAPKLPAMDLATECYRYMFNHCKALVEAPELPATTLATQCYADMFYDCPSLTKAPVLKATVLADNCYSDMFNGCTLLNAVTMLATDMTNAASAFSDNWLGSTAATGTFTVAAGMKAAVTASGIVPSGWTIVEQDQ